ncbi:hypothetical protein [Cochleicola gelatinilyticus]|uniref:Uncharacterized protein n=1 Tax=Cochleicola gelatinilyticus TaxID=1763537 RepID=A0A167J2A0_9FLAO|nr:hypothetical protein [Cochleicola gelatinilyticus]OAB80266.1 hypothetical protein ULVI_05890 [Cochleicola gelatinilyticus]
MFKRIGFIISVLGCITLASCGSDDSRSCTTCTSDQSPTAFEVCQESSGNASVNGENTGTPYDAYISGLQDAGATCGGS